MPPRSLRTTFSQTSASSGTRLEIAFLERQTSSLYAIAVTRDAVAIDQSAMGCRIARLEGLEGQEGLDGPWPQRLRYARRQNCRQHSQKHER